MSAAILEKGFPCPPPKCAVSVVDWKSFEIGDRLDITDTFSTYDSARVRASQAGKRLGRKYAIRAIGRKLYVWRTA